MKALMLLLNRCSFHDRRITILMKTDAENSEYANLRPGINIKYALS